MELSRSLRTLLVAALLLGCWGLVEDLRNMDKDGAIDLRNRVTGARLMVRHTDPYFYKWKIDDGDLFCDPFNASTVPVSKTTVSPLALALNVPFQGLNYRTIQWGWLLVQYLCLAGGFWVWSSGQRRIDLAWGAVFTLLYCFTPSWRLHVDRGQTYVLYASLMLGMAALTLMKTRAREWLEGLGSALLCGLRPVYLGCGGRFLAKRQLPLWAGLVMGAVLVLGAPSLIGGSGIWGNYARAMNVHSQLYLTQTVPARAPMEFSSEVEGMPLDMLAGFAPNIPFGDTSIYKLVSFALPSQLLLIVWAALAVFSGFRRSSSDAALRWWSVAAWAVVGDFLLPAFRNPYNDVLIWPVLLLGLQVLRGGARKTWIAMALLLLLAQTVVWRLPPGFIPVPSAVALLLALVVVVWTAFFADKLGSDVPTPMKPGRHTRRRS